MASLRKENGGVQSSSRVVEGVPVGVVPPGGAIRAVEQPRVGRWRRFAMMAGT